MSLVTWDGSLETGIDEIDRQHKELFRIINSMYDKVERGLPEKTALIEAMDSVHSYAKYHFTTEEKFFDDTDYPDKEQHYEEHSAFSEKLKTIEEMAQDDPSEALSELETYLLVWLIGHIQRVDMKYVPFVKK